MIDIHSHILPNIDDGAHNLDKALTMLKMAEELLIADQVSAIATDCHNLKGRSPDLDKGLEKAETLICKEKANNLVNLNPSSFIQHYNELF